MFSSRVMQALKALSKLGYTVKISAGGKEVRCTMARAVTGCMLYERAIVHTPNGRNPNEDYGEAFIEECVIVDMVDIALKAYGLPQYPISCAVLRDYYCMATGRVFRGIRPMHRGWWVFVEVCTAMSYDAGSPRGDFSVHGSPGK